MCVDACICVFVVNRLELTQKGKINGCPRFWVANQLIVSEFLSEIK